MSVNNIFFIYIILILDSTSLGGRHFFLELVKNIAAVSQLSVQ
jgi:hypothetical protein